MRQPRTPWRRDSGQILILTAFSMVALLGIAALSVDVAFMYDKRNRLHAAADAAAKSGAIEVHRNSTVSDADLLCFAVQQVTALGFSPSGCSLTGTTTVTIRRCNNVAATCTSPFSGNSSFVEAIVSETTSTFFGNALGWTSLTPLARAVAGTASGSNCIVALGPGSPTGPLGAFAALSIGNSTLTLSSCDIAVDGNFDGTNPNATTTGGGMDVSGSCLENCTHINDLSTGTLAVSDPLSGLVAPTVAGSCTNFVADGTATITPGCYSRIQIKGNTTLTFSAGTYKIVGSIDADNHSTITGSGVLLYLTTAVEGATVTGLTCPTTALAGCFNIGNNANWTLSAPTSGTYAGILMFQDPHDQLPALFDGNSPTYNLSGAMYFPKADVSFRNGLNGSNDCTLFVAQSIKINNGNGTFSNTCAAYGGSPIMTLTIAE